MRRSSARVLEGSLSCILHEANATHDEAIDTMLFLAWCCVTEHGTSLNKISIFHLGNSNASFMKQDNALI